MNNIWEIIYTDFDTEYVGYFKMDRYCGDRRMVKVLNMIHYCGKIMSDEDYKQFVSPTETDFEIIGRSMIDAYDVK